VSTLTLDAPRRTMEFTRPSTLTPGQARSWVSRILHDQDVPAAAVDRVAVVVSELVTNACLYGPSDSTVMVSVRLVSAGIEIAVHDFGSIPPERWGASGNDEGGRGLTIVRGMSLLFDVEMHPWGGKTVTSVIA
jgi:anti-sigma regulatory factor (Ser/Thr protein kinase)